MTPGQMKQLAARLRTAAHANRIRSSAYDFVMWANDLAAAADLIEQMAQREGGEQGPWTAELWKAEQVVVASDDFQHDARLLVLGDFADEEQRMQYAQEIARRLNMAQREPLAYDEIESCLPETIHTAEDGWLRTTAQTFHDFARAVEKAHGIRRQQ